MMVDDYISERASFKGTNKVCKCCGKQFVTMFPDEYTYKIRIQGGFLWYCRYNHWIQACREREDKTSKSKVNNGRKKGEK